MIWRLGRVLRRLGILENIWQVLYFGSCALRFGASPYSVFAWAAWRYSSRSALLGEQPKTFAELHLEVCYTARQLLAYGVRPKQRLVLALSNPEQTLRLLLAGLRLGLRVLPINPKSSTLPSADCCFFDSTVLPQKNLPKLLPWSWGGSLLLHTSGSTGAPKEVTTQKLSGAALGLLLERLNLGVEQRILLPLPLFHGHGLATLLLAWLSGSGIFLAQRLELHTQVRAIQAHKLEVLVLVPTLLFRLLEALPDLPLCAIICGSAPLEPMLATRTMQRFGVLYNLYGSSETGLLALATPGDLRQHPNTVGVPIQPLRLQGNQIWLGRINTGDTGYFDQNLLFLTGRQDEMLIVGGVNVYPQALEQQIATLEYIADCAVVGVPDLEFGVVLRLFVVLKREVPLEQMQHDLAQMLPKAQRPKEILVRPQLPRTALGKLQRHLLLE